MRLPSTRLLRVFMLFCVTTMLGACAMPMRIGLKPEDRSKITALAAHVVVVQDEVIAAVHAPNAGAASGGGLIGAMIDASIANSRVKESQQALGSFYTVIEDVDYRKEFNEAIRSELANYQIKVATVTTTPRALNMDILAKLRNQLPPGQALLLIYPRYSLTADFRNFDSESQVSMWARSDSPSAAGGMNTPIQRSVLYFQSQSVGTGGRKSLDLWGAQNAELFRSAMRESITETLRMAMIDLDVAAEPAAKGGNLEEFSFNNGVITTKLKGQVVKNGDTRAILLASDQKLYSLPRTSTSASAAASTSTAAAK
ncbi:hypothetical protein J2W32_006677 [Variovorax boronicumulans]|jgi:hypothetical protein|uniref:Uncharacterized protein n=1 Tax=Variovorax boronicumulans TaxID=436515 RepID=A0AAW8DBS5_9BURK|nr:MULTISPECIES: hypothetical protein [Variovorax]MDP9897558.1 hypothetical protein [Variovorax boronicumulans]MDQ0032808.1 hypothetical protein [Variovorax boronicumulans]MDQ0039783.1 hypothetical protein [Variovorax boronicumulans]MDQ0057597.1 hypothetical protein [Variovorax boronicumulans]MDQ0068791.1 hypothetical protein [Variovorax boronicumulans]